MNIVQRERRLARLHSLRLPPVYDDVTIDSFPEHLRQHLGKSLIITGEPGTGKSAFMAALAKAQVEISLATPWPTKSGYARFISVPDLLAKFRETFSGDESEAELFEEYAGCCWLYLDDLGTEQGTDWAFQVLYRLIDRRWAYKMNTVVSTNLPLKDLEGNSKRIASRLVGMGKVVCFGGSDLRRGR